MSLMSHDHMVHIHYFLKGDSMASPFIMIYHSIVGNDLQHKMHAYIKCLIYMTSSTNKLEGNHPNCTLIKINIIIIDDVTEYINYINSYHHSLIYLLAF